jgi:hypothetical protein
MLFRLLRYFLWIGCFVHKIFFLAAADVALELNSEQGLTRVTLQRQTFIVFAPEASSGFPLKGGGVTKLAARNKIVSNPGRLTSHRSASGNMAQF